MLEIYDKNYTKILEALDKYCDLGGDLSSDCFRDSITEPLKHCSTLPSWTYDSGATKLVLIFHGMDTVIKIPFTGNNEDYYVSGDPNASCIHNFSHSKITSENSKCKCWECSYEQCPRRAHYDYQPFYGSPASVEWDYCAAEETFYKYAEEMGIESFFAKTWIIGRVNSHPIYAQVRAEMFEGTSGSKKYSKEKVQATEHCVASIERWCFNEYWLTDFREYFGNEYLEPLLAFLEENEIEDLHAGNLGYVDGVPVLVDYAGYNH